MRDICASILEDKIIVIVRGTYGEELVSLAEALYKGGVRLMEVTFDQSAVDGMERTTNAIRLLRTRMADDMGMGAGTVMTPAAADAAHEAGARFIISPNADPDVIRHTKALGLVSIPGAMTPTEIARAHACGADFVKIFPADTLGSRYIRSVLAPLSNVRLLATSGITEENFPEFLKAGCAGAGISGRLTDKALIHTGDWAELTRRARAFCKIAAEN